MKNRLYVAVLLILVAGIYVGCSDGVVNVDNRYAAGPNDHIFEIRVGQTVMWDSEGLVITFDSTIHESRCPMNACCIWPGMAQIQTYLATRDRGSAFARPSIIGMGEDSNSVNRLSDRALCYDVALLVLAPYPQDFGEPDPKEYVATIRVTKVEPSECYPQVIITDTPPDSLLLDPYWLEDLSIDGDVLTISLTYSGGCNDHDYQLYMSPAAFMESYPVQANLYLWHNGYDDACDAIIAEDVRFDITPIAMLYDSHYPGSEGIVVLNVIGYIGGYSTEFQSITYEF